MEGEEDRGEEVKGWRAKERREGRKRGTEGKRGAEETHHTNSSLLPVPLVCNNSHKTKAMHSNDRRLQQDKNLSVNMFGWRLKTHLFRH